MTIYGVALLALCYMVGSFLGDALGMLLHVKANVGGVGIAMLLLIISRTWLKKSGKLTHPLKLGIEFWAALYIPIVVAMASIQNVIAAVDGGPMVLIAAFGTVALVFGCTALLGRFVRGSTNWDPHAESVLSGDPE
jgi:malonate transporter MadL subunit